MKLERELRESDEVVVLLTDRSVESPNVMFEIGLAAGLRLPVTMIELGVKPELQSNVGLFQHVRYSNLNQYLRKLRERLGKPVSSNAKPPKDP